MEKKLNSSQNHLFSCYNPAHDLTLRACVCAKYTNKNTYLEYHADMGKKSINLIWFLGVLVLSESIAQHLFPTFFTRNTRPLQIRWNKMELPLYHYTTIHHHTNKNRILELSAFSLSLSHSLAFRLVCVCVCARVCVCVWYVCKCLWWLFFLRYTCFCYHMSSHLSSLIQGSRPISRKLTSHR